jgi:hypothetical protein
MKHYLKQAAFAFGIMAIALIGCRKESLNLNPSLNPSSESEIQSLVIQTDQESEALETTFNESTNEIAVVNEGLAADYLVTEYDFNTESGSDPANASSLNRSFIRCLKDLKLEEDQIKKIRMALTDYEDCKSSAIKRARAIHHDLVAKYRELAAEQAKLLRAGKITKAEFEQRISRLRHAFMKELRALQLKEKLNEALKNCHNKLLRQINGILNERQWKAFIACYKK